MSKQAASEVRTCDSCQHLGRMYWDNGFSYTHHCGKSSDRRAEGMPKGADFFDHFRTFFDAECGQKACRHYVERPIADEKTLALLRSMEATNGRGEFEFFSKESALAHELDDKFVRYDLHAQRSKPGNRVFYLLPVGTAELKRAQCKAK